MIAKKIIAPDAEDRRKRGSSRDADAATRALARPLPAGTGRGWRAGRQGPARGPRPPGWSIAQHRAAFRQNVEYLIRGDKQPDGSRPYPDDGAGRVAEIHVFNVPGLNGPQGAAELRRAADWMSDTAGLNRQLSSSAVLHYQLAAPPEDRDKIHRTPQFWSSVGDEALKALGLEHHQAAIIVHADTDHPHCHLIVNRVDPITARAANPWNDVIRLERAMRQIEQRFGLRSVQGRHVDAQTLGPIPRQRPIPKTRPASSRIETEEVARDWRRRLADKPFSTAKSWDELAARLAESGLHLETSGRGLRIAGDFTVPNGKAKLVALKLSKIAGKAGNREALESRFGQTFTDWLANQSPTATTATAEQIAEAKAEQEAREAAERQRQQQDRERAAYLRSLLSQPARVAERPSLFPSIGTIPPACRGVDLRDALELAALDDLSRLAGMTEQAEAEARRQEAGAEGTARADLRDAIAQLQAGHREIDAEMQRRNDTHPTTAEPPNPTSEADGKASVADGREIFASASATDACLVDPAKREAAKFAVRQLTNDQLLAALTATRSELSTRGQAGDQVGMLFAKTGVQILEADAIRRGLIQIPTRAGIPKKQIERD